MNGKDNSYCYPSTNVLKNKLDIRDSETLSAAERELTSVQEFMLRVKPLKGDFDYKHLQDIHKKLFGEIYTWAGKLRTVNIGKGNTFCYVANLQEYGNEIFSRVKKDRYLVGLNREQAIKKLSECLGDINALHPYRDGNGRSQRQFIGYLAKATGIELAFDRTNADEMLEASKKSFLCDCSLYQRILNDIAVPMTLAEQHGFLKSTSKAALKIFEDMRDTNDLPDRTEEFNKKPLADNDHQQNDYKTLDGWKKDIAELHGKGDASGNETKINTEIEMNKDK